ncbi:hypothetical protein N7509_000427 [Penicillium cosmopolitanum]|uniref:Uncharacterized protein n=1 Tax=Penicillium cosmopolitanum TaxID=1131564 RepID=A0A9W9WA94_9EURO|nr:uncharacterized protein N7509_000427 [Penicillium cosmopolitanum]KAJ5413800.1 hypothetical protein N7509_000427 [Penicillium cosmopolitanum]
MESYSWTIPLNIDTAAPKYLLGLFDGDAELGTDAIADYGWISWSPYFYVREKSSTTSASSSVTVTTPVTGTAATITNTPIFSPNSSPNSSSESTKIGVGVGVGIGVALLIALGFGWFLNRLKKSRRNGEGVNYEEGGNNEPTPTAELPDTYLSELPIKEPVAIPSQANMVHEVE